MSEKKTVTRRRFLGAAAGAITAPMVVPSSVLGLRGAPPSERLLVGVIGAGGMARANAGGFLRNDTSVVAMCDVDSKQLDEAVGEIKKRRSEVEIQKLDDFRKLVDLKDLNIIVVATPDHWHALCAIQAVRAKKHVYCEKPMTHTFGEGQALVAAVKESGVRFQVGSQQRSSWEFRRGVDIVWNGLLGKIKNVEVGLPTGGGHKRDSKAQDPPSHLDYDFWCGPSEKLPYHPDRLHWNWRWHLSYGGGQLMDWIGHHNDISHWGLGRDGSGPSEIKAVGFEYPADRTVWNAATKYEVLCTYDDGVVSSISNKNPMGCKWIGEKGWVHVDRGSIKASNPEWVKREFDPGPKKAYKSDDHRANLIDCIRSGKDTICTAEIGHRSITPGHIGLLSEALGGRVIRWDPRVEKVIGDEEADKLLKKVSFREPWSLSRIS